MFKISKLNFVFILIIVLIIETWLIISLINNQKDFNRMSSEMFEENYNLKFRIKGYQEKFEQNIFSENMILKSFVLQDTNDQKLVIDSLVLNTKLLYRFSEVSCRACVENDLEIIKQLGGIIGYDNILIISNFSSTTKSQAMLMSMETKSPYYNYRGKLGVPMEKDSIEEPAFFFLLDEKRRIRFAYRTDAAHNFSSPYFKRIKQFFNIGI